MGAVGGGIWHLVKGTKNSPSGARMRGGLEVSFPLVKAGGRAAWNTLGALCCPLLCLPYIGATSLQMCAPCSLWASRITFSSRNMLEISLSSLSSEGSYVSDRLVCAALNK
jgi:hypothetical protein